MTVAARREAIECLLTRGVSQRRACVLLQLLRSTFSSQARPDRHRERATQVYELAHRHPCYGYRRMWTWLRWRGQRVYQKHMHRLWKRAQLQVRKVTRERGLARAASIPVQATHPGHVWTYDFLHDRCPMGTPLKVLTSVDKFTREGLALGVATSLPSQRVLTILERLVVAHGAPQSIRSDNGPESLALAVRV